MSRADNPILNTASGQPERLLTTASYPKNPATAFARWLGKTGSQVGSLFTRSRANSRGAYWARELRLRATILKDEHPMSLLGAMAGAAFALGIVTRVWRYRR